MKVASFKKWVSAILCVCVLIIALTTSVAQADNNCMSVSGITDNPLLTYIGNWTHNSGFFVKACNTTLSWSDDPTAKVSFNFTGNSITRLYTMAWNRGVEYIYIDGVHRDTINSYAPTTRWQVAKTWQVASGNHTVEVRVVGGTVGYSDIDAFVVNIPTVSYGGYEDTHAQLQYVGNWTHGTGWPSASNGTVSWSNNFDAYQGPDAISFTFAGEQVTYKYTKAFNRGKAAITIDGVDFGTLDLYSATTQWQQTSTFYNLGSGVHTIHIAVTGDKNPASSDYYVDVDAIYVHNGQLQNATEKKDVTNWGASASINWTDPALVSGLFSYQRAVTAQSSPWRFVELGWLKTNQSHCGLYSSFCALVAWNDGGPVPLSQSFATSQATHTYQIQYDPNTAMHWFYIDGSYVFNVNANFSSGNFVGAGGEVGRCCASMGHTLFNDLRYLQQNPDGSFAFVNWNGHVNYVDNPPYFNIDNGLNSFYADGPGGSP